jgi:hypothetical protein
LQAALDYLGRGWSSLSLCPPDHLGVDAAHGRLCTAAGEVPLWPWKEYEQRLPSPRELAIYWNRNPHANVGIVLGTVSGLVALALDAAEGVALWQPAHDQVLPETLEYLAPDGGRRLLYALPASGVLACASLRRLCPCH